MEASLLKIGYDNEQWDHAFSKLSWWNPSTIANSKVMVVGAGALGNEVLKNLALLGIGNILIVDFDIVEYSNLSKSILFSASDKGHKKAEVAAAKVRQINPNITVQHIQGDITYEVGLGIFKRMDVVIGCLDNRLARRSINRHAFKVGKTWIDGGIEDLNGQLNVYKPGVSCYECQLSEGAKKNIRVRLSCPDIAQRNANVGTIATTPISSSIIAALQVQEALKIIFKNTKNSLAGHSFVYWGMSNTFMQFTAPGLKKNCESNCINSSIEVIPSALSASHTLVEALEALKALLKSDTVIIRIPYEIILRVVTKTTYKEYQVCIPKYKLSNDMQIKFQVEPGEKVGFPGSDSTTNQLDDSFPYPDKTLLELGIPELQILTVDTGNNFYFVELTGDETFLNSKPHKL